MASIREGDSFIRRRGRGGSSRTLRITCPRCGFLQWDVKATSKQGSADMITCVSCHYEGPVIDR